jgi:hypothetical protein
MSQRSTSNGTVDMPGPGWHDDTWWPSVRADNGCWRFHCPNRRPLLSQRRYQVLPSHYWPFHKPVEDALARSCQASTDERAKGYSGPPRHLLAARIAETMLPGSRPRRGATDVTTSRSRSRSICYLAAALPLPRGHSRRSTHHATHGITTGEPVAVSTARRVRRGADGKGPNQGTSPAAYPTRRAGRGNGPEVIPAPRPGPTLPAATQLAGTPASSARVSRRRARVGFVANPTGSGTPTATHLSGSVVQDFGR